MKRLGLMLALVSVVAVVACSKNRLTGPGYSAQWGATSGPPGGSIQSFAVAGTNLFAAGGAVFRSTDDGANWTDISIGSPNVGASALAVSGTSLFAAGGGVFRSTDNGGSWTDVSSGLTGKNVVALAISGTNLFAGYVNSDNTTGGVVRSNDNGASWTDASSGLNSLVVRALAATGTTLFAATTPGFEVPKRGHAGSGRYLGVAYGLLYRSTDDGASWTDVSSGLTNVVNAFADGGTSLFAGTNGGVFRSNDNGTSWIDVSSGLRGKEIEALAILGANLFAGTSSNGVWRYPLN